MAKTLTEMAAEIVAAQAGHAAMSAEDMDAALKRTFESLQNIQSMEEGAEISAAGPAMDPKASIQRAKVICLECGKEFRQLTSIHLQEHGLDAKAYRKKYGFPARQPLTAKSLSAKRRRVAKELGLAEKLLQARKAKVKPKPPKPAKKRTVRRKKKAATAPSKSA